MTSINQFHRAFQPDGAIRRRTAPADLSDTAPFIVSTIATQLVIGIGYYLKSVAKDPHYAEVREYLGEAYVIKGDSICS